MLWARTYRPGRILSLSPDSLRRHSNNVALETTSFDESRSATSLPVAPSGTVTIASPDPSPGSKGGGWKKATRNQATSRPTSTRTSARRRRRQYAPRGRGGPGSPPSRPKRSRRFIRAGSLLSPTGPWAADGSLTLRPGASTDAAAGAEAGASAFRALFLLGAFGGAAACSALGGC